MAISPEQLAAALVSENLPSPGVAAVVAARARFASPVVLQVPPPSDVAERLSVSAEAAVSFALSIADPDYLGRAARDPRITVRRAVAFNANTPPAALEYLLEVAIKKQDSLLADALAANIGLDTVIEHLREIPATDYFCEQISGRVIEDSDTSMLLRALGTAHRTLVLKIGATLGRSAQSTQISAAVHFARVTFSPALSTEMLSHIVANSKEVGYPLAALAVEDVASLAGITDYAGDLSNDVASLLLSTGAPEACTFVAGNLAQPRRQGTLSGELVDHLLVVATTEAAPAVAKISACGLSAGTVQRMISWLVSFDAPLDLARYLTSPTAVPSPPRLDTPTVVEVLHHARLEQTKQWLSGNLSQLPRPGEVTSVINDAVQGSYSTFHQALAILFAPRTITPAEIAKALPLDKYLDLPWSDEIVDALGAEVFNRLKFPAASAYVAQRISAALGDDPPAWDQMFGLLPGYSGTLNDLLDVARRLQSAKQ
jgi:hypothetical protein